MQLAKGLPAGPGMRSSFRSDNRIVGIGKGHMAFAPQSLSNHITINRLLLFPRNNHQGEKGGASPLRANQERN